MSGSVRGSSKVSHQQISRFAADLPAAHFLSQSKAYAASPGLEQGRYTDLCFGFLKNAFFEV